MKLKRDLNLIITKKKDFFDDESPSFFSYLYKQGFLVLASLKVGKRYGIYIIIVIIQFHHIIVESVH